MGLKTELKQAWRECRSRTSPAAPDPVEVAKQPTVQRKSSAGSHAGTNSWHRTVRVITIVRRSGIKQTGRPPLQVVDSAIDISSSTRDQDSIKFKPAGKKLHNRTVSWQTQLIVDAIAQLAYIMYCWYLVLVPPASHHLPSSTSSTLPLLPIQQHAAQAAQTLNPISVPTSLSPYRAWELGRLSGLYEASAIPPSTLLANSSTLLNFPYSSGTSPETILHIRHLLRESETIPETSVVNSAHSLAEALFILAALGLNLLVLPAVLIGFKQMLHGVLGFIAYKMQHRNRRDWLALIMPLKALRSAVGYLAAGLLLTAAGRIADATWAVAFVLLAQWLAVAVCVYQQSMLVIDRRKQEQEEWEPVEDPGNILLTTTSSSSISVGNGKEYVKLFSRSSSSSIRRCPGVTTIGSSSTSGGSSSSSSSSSRRYHRSSTYNTLQDIFEEKLLRKRVLRIAAFATLALSASTARHQSQLLGLLATFALSLTFNFGIIPLRFRLPDSWEAAGHILTPALRLVQTAAGFKLGLLLLGRVLLVLAPGSPASLQEFFSAFEIGFSALGGFLFFAAGFMRSSKWIVKRELRERLRRQQQQESLECHPGVTGVSPGGKIPIDKGLLQAAYEKRNKRYNLGLVASFAIGVLLRLSLLRDVSMSFLVVVWFSRVLLVPGVWGVIGTFTSIGLGVSVMQLILPN